MPKFYEFFAGVGMARQGLGPKWQCLFANDFDQMKATIYQKNWGFGDMVVGDISNVTATQLPKGADLAWASFPCQDLSLAGNCGGIGKANSDTQTRSGSFWTFWQLMKDLNISGSSPKIIVLENVQGVLTAKNGQDFAAIGDCFTHANYKFGAVLVDAAKFLPHSRPRVFIIGVRNDISLPLELTTKEACLPWHPPALLSAFSGMSAAAKRAWVWWNMPIPKSTPVELTDIVSDQPIGVDWHTKQETQRLIDMMTPRNLEKLAKFRRQNRRVVGTIYRRTRQGVQRAELRNDGIAGCLRTPAGGSSRQFVIVVNGSDIRTRLLSAREAADLMGIPADFVLPHNYNDAYHVAGDGVAVPVVEHLRKSLLDPLTLAHEIPTIKYAIAAE